MITRGWEDSVMWSYCLMGMEFEMKIWGFWLWGWFHKKSPCWCHRLQTPQSENNPLSFHIHHMHTNLGWPPTFQDRSKIPTLGTSHSLDNNFSAHSSFLYYRIRMEKWGLIAGFNLAVQYLWRVHSVRLSDTSGNAKDCIKPPPQSMKETKGWLYPVRLFGKWVNWGPKREIDSLILAGGQQQRQGENRIPGCRLRKQ